MKIINFLQILLLTFVIHSCVSTRKISYENPEVKNFKNWEKDSIKNFLLGNWVRIGAFDGKNIIEDTLATYHVTMNDKEIIYTEIVNPNGLYRLIDNKLEKQYNIPVIRFDFYEGWADLHEATGFPPDFISLERGFCCFNNDRLIFNGNNPIREITSLNRTVRVKNPIHYIKEYIIFIENVAYIRDDKWEEYSKSYSKTEKSSN